MKLFSSHGIFAWSSRLFVFSTSLMASGILCQSFLSAKTADQIRVYINPGHGAWDSESRGMDIIRDVNGTIKIVKNNASSTTGATPDTTAFFESNTNLWRAFGIVDKLQQMGLVINRSKNSTNSDPYRVGAALDLSNNICMSRTKSGPYPVNSSNKVCDVKLSTMCAEINANNFDAFVSPHSNALTDGSTVNYVALFYRGYSRSGGDKVSGSISLGKAIWPQIRKNTHNRWTARHTSAEGDGVVGDISFYQSGSSTSSGYLGALKHNVPGILCEGYFHTYQPARQRAMQRKYDVIDGYLIARGIAAYFGLPADTKGDICGVVRSKTENFSHSLYTPSSSTKDGKKPINGATVVLKKDGVEVATMATDNNYNGIFVFTDLVPGTYTVDVIKRGYKTYSYSQVVTAGETAFPEIDMTIGDSNEFRNDPLALTEKWNFSSANSNKVQGNVDDGTYYDASKIRNFCYNNGKLYCVYNHAEILVLNAQTGEKIMMLDNGDVVAGGTLTLCDVKCIDDHIIACNLATASNNDILRFYCWDTDDSPARLIKTVSDLRGCKRVGDCMEISGSWNGDMYLTFVDDDGSASTRILDFYRRGGEQNGVGNWGCNVYYAMNPSLTGRLGCSKSARAIKKDGGWWIDGYNCYPTWCTLNSSNQAVAQVCLVTGASDNIAGTGHREFNWRGDHYCADMILDGYYNGRFHLTLNNAGNYLTPLVVGQYPSVGLGSTQNGNATTDCIVNTDGSTYVEIWVNSTGQGMCYYSFGNVPRYGIDPILSLNKTNLEFETEVGVSVTQEVICSGRFVNEDIVAEISGPDAQVFTIDPRRLNTDGLVVVYYNPRYAGTHEATLTFSCGTCNPQSVELFGVSNEKIVYNYEVSGLTEMWTFSQSRGNLDDADWVLGGLCENITRDLQFINGRLYAANNSADVDGCQIFVIDPYSGQSMQPVNTSGIEGGRLILGGLTGLSGHLLASNSAEPADEIKIYIWDDEQDPPRVWLSTTDHGDITVGDQMNASGTMDNGFIWFSNGEKIVRYTVTDGFPETTPTIINLSHGVLTEHGKADVTPMPDGTFWVTGTGSLPQLYSADGMLIGTLNANSSNLSDSRHCGTGLAVIPFGSRTYIAGITYTGTSEAMSRGGVALVDVTDAIATMALSRGDGDIDGDLVGIYPESGLGTTPNSIHETSVTYEVANDGSRLNLWGVVPYQGVTHLAYDGETHIVTGVESVTAAHNAPLTFDGVTIHASEGTLIEVFTPAGIKVATTASGLLSTTMLKRGIYIVQAKTTAQNTTTIKIMVGR